MFDSRLQQIIDNATGVDTSLQQNADTIAKLQQQIADGPASEAADELALIKDAIAGRTFTINGVNRKMKVFSNLQRFPLLRATSPGQNLGKPLFTWLQPWNVGNSGGGTPDNHGVETMVKIDNHPTAMGITWKPVKLSGGRSDNAFNYLILPFPDTEPTEFVWHADQYNAAGAVDWTNCQQAENQNELIENGFTYNMACRYSPTKGFGYFDFVSQGWKNPFSSSPVMVDLHTATSITQEHSIDRDKHTVTLRRVTFNIGTSKEQIIDVNLTYEAGHNGNTTAKQFSTSFQLDGQAAAPAYSFILDGMTTAYA